ncbi:MAG: hypothetical protein LBB15_00935 [Puniceicoccales bacterium]|jgi:hypothetical protein|nr:hypothetical protein [Puniceicoccales bacterium]
MGLSRKTKQYLFVVAAIILIVGALFVLKKSFLVWRVTPSLPEKIAIPVSHATAELLNFDDTKVTWKSDKQPDGQPPFFELFTPPNIYRDGKQITMEPCTHWQFDFIFPIQLKHVVRKKYRLQLEGYLQADVRADFTILIRDIENDQMIHCSVGQAFKALEFEVLSFKVQTIEKNDMIINMPVVKIRDTRDHLELELTGDTKYYDNKYVAIVEDLDGNVHTFSNIGQEIKIGESICVLETLDAKNNMVSITLTDANKQEFRKNLRILR